MPLRSHPQGVAPEGQILLLGPEAARAAHAARAAGLCCFAALDDATLLRICGFAAPEALAILCSASDTFAAFASFEEYWRLACIRLTASAPLTKFSGSWKATYRAMRSDAAPSTHGPRQPSRSRGVSLFSDALYLSHQLTHGPNHFGAVPRGPPCARLPKATSPATFSDAFETGAGQPLVLEAEDVAVGTAALGAASGSWDEASLRATLGDRIFHAGGVNFHLSDYLDYAQTNTDDQVCVRHTSS